MTTTRTLFAGCAAAALFTGLAVPTAGADVGPLCNDYARPLVAFAANAMDQTANPPAPIPGKMVVSAIPTQWKDSDWNASLSWRNVDLGTPAGSVHAPARSGVAFFDRVPTGAGTVTYTVRVNRFGPQPATLECHGVVRIA